METKFNQKQKELKDFNLIYPISFEVVSLPLIIPGSFLENTPKRIEKWTMLGKKMIENPLLPNELHLSGGEIVVVNNIVYKKVIDYNTGSVSYDCFQNVTEEVYGIMNLLEIKNIIDFLTKSKKKFISPKLLLQMPGFVSIKNEIGNIQLKLKNDVSKGNNIRECVIEMSFSKDGNYFSMDIGKLVYFIYGRR